MLDFDFKDLSKENLEKLFDQKFSEWEYKNEVLWSLENLYWKENLEDLYNYCKVSKINVFQPLGCNAIGFFA
ncbi:hypothetical protein [Clostridium felsineum]|uniref:hypothetical protein n=1 Tax=Clostridium felsineum TaxID=36839 RepID=UPI00098CCB7F|nr:hypothetical protein [Clostridium felsineum]URZ00580.1 hypothetical protein CLAUR_005680 [Clostridium felsineum]